MELTVINVFVLMDLLVNCVILALITALANLVLMVQHATTFKGTFPAHVLQDLKDTFVKMTPTSAPHNLVSMVAHVRTS